MLDVEFAQSLLGVDYSYEAADLGAPNSGLEGQTLSTFPSELSSDFKQALLSTFIIYNGYGAVGQYVATGAISAGLGGGIAMISGFIGLAGVATLIASHFLSSPSASATVHAQSSLFSFPGAVGYSQAITIGYSHEDSLIISRYVSQFVLLNTIMKRSAGASVIPFSLLDEIFSFERAVSDTDYDYNVMKEDFLDGFTWEPGQGSLQDRIRERWYGDDFRNSLLNGWSDEWQLLNWGE